jgi:hypothetical protein
MDNTFFDQKFPVKSAMCIPLHENSLQFTAAPGEYVVVLSTHLPRAEGQFFARMIIEKNFHQMG